MQDLSSFHYMGCLLLQTLLAKTAVKHLSIQTEVGSCVLGSVVVESAVTAWLRWSLT
jgi:hypothetical protein